MEQLTKVLKVLADNNRLRILKLLESNKFCVCELASILGITQPSASRHLKKLKSVGLISDEQQSFWTNCFIDKSCTGYGKHLMRHIHGWLNDDPEIKSDLGKAKKLDSTKSCCK